MIWIIMIGFMIVGGIVNSRLKSKIKKYSQIRTISGMSGKEIAYANDALKWAASTYVVAALAAATYLLYYVSMLKD